MVGLKFNSKYKSNNDNKNKFIVKHVFLLFYSLYYFFENVICPRVDALTFVS